MSFPPTPPGNRGQNDKQPDDPGKSRPPSPLSQLPRWLIPVIVILLLVWSASNLTDLLNGSNNRQPIPYSAVYELVEAYSQQPAGNVCASLEGTNLTADQPLRVEALIDNTSVMLGFPCNVQYPSANSALLSDETITSGTFNQFVATQIPSGDLNLADNLREQGVILVGRFNQPNTLLNLLFNFAPFLLLLGFLMFSLRNSQRQMSGVFGFGRTQAREYNTEKPQITFADVAGQDAAKSELVEIVDFLKEPDKYIALGARIPRGVLLIGPPGTGKTLLARAVAGEAGVAIFSIAASEFVEMYVGVGASSVRD